MAGFTAACLPALWAPVHADEGTALPPDVRRIVTVNDADGAPVVLADGPSDNVRVLNGSRITRIWETSEMPVPLDVTTDAGATAGNAYRDGFVGTSLYTADIPPGSDLEDIPMHAQDSLDYIAVMEGEIDLVLPDRSVTMRAGDVLVQAGTVHSWVNRGDLPARLLVVVLTGER
jgi:mannose-6-phosphate isomerase-like protein (cupin superfamily)